MVCVGGKCNDCGELSCRIRRMGKVKYRQNTHHLVDGHSKYIVTSGRAFRERPIQEIRSNIHSQIMNGFLARLNIC